MTELPGQIHVVLSDVEGARVVGMAARARNERVVERAGATLLARSELAALPDGAAVLLVSHELTFNVALFAALPAVPPEPLRVGGGGGAYALFGRAAALRPLADAYLDGTQPDEGLPLRTVGARELLSLSPPGSPRAATWALLRQAQKATDGIVSRTLNRPLSRFFSYWFLALGMTPMHASAINLAIGLACAFYAAQTGPWTMLLAGALFHFASAFDGVDGEMARTTLSESPRGAWVDTAVDNLTYVACLFGVTIGWVREGVGGAGLVLAGLLVVGVPLTLLSLMRFVRRYGPDGSLVFVDRCIAHAADESGAGALRVARVLFHALRRDVFALLFFALSLAGQRAVVPIAVGCGLGVALLTLTTQRKRIVDAAIALRAAG